ncbi:MAG TPA: response regulator [Isosphaeraceae bacterium]|jgi:CheY-like chemotaxis protein|nr:response regulator [Isosphaeraceae bacterium]
MHSPLILVIDDSLTARKMVEFHLTQAGYRVASAPDAERGLDIAAKIAPDLILLDHQLPGTTGDEVCRRLLKSEATAKIPVVISSAMRNRAFACYTELANVVDQIPKPYTPELLKSGVGNALQTGAMVVQAQRTGCAMPESVDEPRQFALEGDTSLFPINAVLGFLNNGQQEGRLTLEAGQERIRFLVSAGRIQAVVSATFSPDRLASLLPPEMADLAPLTSITLREQQDAQTSGLIRMLERSLSDPRRIRALLRFQSAVLTHSALKCESGRFSFEPQATMPPMFQAFPLQVSLTALAVEGVRRCERPDDPARCGSLIFARQAPRGGSLDRTGLSPTELKLHSLMDGNVDLAAIARETGLGLIDVAIVARGLELAGLAERRSAPAGASVLVLEDDIETVRIVQEAFGPSGKGYQLKVVRDRVAAQLLLRRNKFDLVLMALDRPDQEQFYRFSKSQAPSSTRFVGILAIHDESELVRLEAMGLDGILHRPLTEDDLLSTVNHLMEAEVPVGAVAAPSTPRPDRGSSMSPAMRPVARPADDRAAVKAHVGSSDTLNGHRDNE